MIHLNKKNSFITLFVLALAILASEGCANRVSTFTVVSTKEVDLSGNTKLDPSNGQKYFGEDCGFFLFEVPSFAPYTSYIQGIPLSDSPNLDIAINRALKKGGGNIMVNEVTTLSKVWVLAGTIECLAAEGVVMTAPYKGYP